MNDIACCDAHGYFAAETCPTCGAAGTHVLNGTTRRQVSKFLSGALRHFPGDAGLALNDAGWTALDSVVTCAAERYDIGREAVVGIIQTDPKGRFEVDDDRLRAAYGHSISVDLDAGGTAVPETLYHGTTPDALVSIREEGLRPMGRQYVHLSESVGDAKSVGSRHVTTPVVLQVDAAAVGNDGRTITKRGPAVYTTAHVPPRYLSELD